MLITESRLRKIIAEEYEKLTRENNPRRGRSQPVNQFSSYQEAQEYINNSAPPDRKKALLTQLQQFQKSTPNEYETFNMPSELHNFLKDKMDSYQIKGYTFDVVNNMLDG